MSRNGIPSFDEVAAFFKGRGQEAVQWVEDELYPLLDKYSNDMNGYGEISPLAEVALIGAIVALAVLVGASVIGRGLYKNSKETGLDDLTEKNKINNSTQYRYV